jgi:peroxiredoxin
MMSNWPSLILTRLRKSLPLHLNSLTRKKMPTKPVCNKLQKKLFGVHKSSSMIKTSMFTILIFYGLVLSIILSLTEDGVHNAFTTTTSSTFNSTILLQGDVRPAPKYSATTLDGKIASLEDFRGNPVLINVWATWCVPCREEMPALEALYNEFSNKGLQVIGVSVDSHSSENRIKSFIDRMGITYTIWHDPNDKFTRAFRTIGVPESFLINPQGQIVHTWKGPFDATSQDTKARVVDVLSPRIATSPGITSSGNNGVDGSSQIDTALNASNSTSSVSSAASIPASNNGTSGPLSASSQASFPQTSKQQEPITTTTNTQQQSNYQTIGYPVAFVAGILSFLSPCILPLIPSYVAFITGMSMEELTFNKNKKGENKNRDLGSRKAANINDTDNLTSSKSSSSKLRKNYTYTSSKQDPFSSMQRSSMTGSTAIIRGTFVHSGIFCGIRCIRSIYYCNRCCF